MACLEVASREPRGTFRIYYVRVAVGSCLGLIFIARATIRREGKPGSVTNERIIYVAFFTMLNRCDPAQSRLLTKRRGRSNERMCQGV
jgi:hypothetical protein